MGRHDCVVACVEYGLGEVMVEHQLALMSRSPAIERG
jgi:hypothetical protein